MKSQYAYDKAQFEFQAFRRHILSDVRYFGHLLPDLLILSSKPHDPNPKYVIPLQLTVSVGWILEKRPNVAPTLKAFTVKYFDTYKDFHAPEATLLKQRLPHICPRLKDMLRNRVTFYKIADFYEAQYNLGKGSSAKVIQIKELNQEKRQLAAKAIDKQYLLKGDSGMHAFLSEVSILHQLSTIPCGPFIKLYETFEGDKTYYLIMDLMKGRTLSEEIDLYNQKKDLLPNKIVKSIMRQLLTGVKILHENNIIHRDLKPDNIMFKEAENHESLTLVDFGLATSTEVVKYSFPKCGTPGYVAPEVLNLIDRDHKYDKVCDLFSCGCIFYKLLTGSSLFYGNTFNEILKMNKLCNINFDSFQLLDISDEALSLLVGLLQKNPSERYTAKQALESDYFKSVNSPKKSQKKRFTDNYTLLSFEPRNMFQPCDTESSEALSPFQKQAFKRNGDFDEDITENNGQQIQIRQMPSVKKPTYCRQQVDSSIGSFYAKDPLSSFKKLKKDSIKQLQEVLSPNKENGQYMQKISLFTQFRTSDIQKQE